MTKKEFCIDDYIKPKLNIVVELDDGVEYLIEKEAIASIKNKESTVILKRLFDRKNILLSTKKVITALEVDGPVDYLNI